MVLAQFVHDYGYPVLVLWCFLGAEEGVLAGGMLASQGHLSPVGVALASAIGGALGDQVYFYLARAYGGLLLARSTKLQKFYPRAERIVKRYGAAVACVSRFLVGLRIAMATACGIFRMPALRYSVLNLAGAMVWASLFTTAGYYWGRTMETTLQHGESNWLWVALEIVLGVALLFLWLRFQRKRAIGPELDAPDSIGMG